jgi:RHS repeat-associated protein
VSTSNGWNFTYDANGNTKTSRGATINWTSFNQPSSIATGTVSSAFAYTPDRRYWQQVAQYANGTATTTYLGGMFQKVVGATTEYRHIIKAGSATIVVTRSTGSNNNTYYVTQDNLGSSSVVTDSTGAVMVNESFGAYGTRRGSSWTGVPSTADYSNIAGVSRSGYTGHDMLDNVNFIHMNGRVFDNLTGRFLSPDPVIDEPGSSQAFNPYSYVFNSPLSYTDPTGYDCTDPGVNYDDDGVGTVGICSPQDLPPLPPLELVPIGLDSTLIDTAWRNFLNKNPVSGSTQGIFSSLRDRACHQVARNLAWESTHVPGFPIQIDTDLERQMLNNYIEGGGNVKLSPNDFSVLSNMLTDPTNRSILLGHQSFSDNFTGTRYLFLGRSSGRFDFTFGTATGIFTNGQLTGVRDSFDFNWRPFFGAGSRGGFPSGTAVEIATRDIDLTFGLFCEHAEPGRWRHISPVPCW